MSAVQKLHVSSWTEEDNTFISIDNLQFFSSLFEGYNERDRQHVNYTAEYLKMSAYLSLDFLTLYSKVNKWKKWSCI